MSVPVSKRGTSKLEIIQLANDIEVQLIRIVGNDKYVSKRNRFLFAKDTITTAMNVAGYFCSANALQVTANEVKYNERYSYQCKGYAELGRLEHQLNVLYALCNIPHGLMNEIFDKILSIKNKYNGWIKSDRQRFQKLTENI